MNFRDFLKHGEEAKTDVDPVEPVKTDETGDDQVDPSKEEPKE